MEQIIINFIFGNFYYGTWNGYGNCSSGNSGNNFFGRPFIVGFIDCRFGSEYFPSSNANQRKHFTICAKIIFYLFGFNIRWPLVNSIYGELYDRIIQQHSATNRIKNKKIQISTRNLKNFWNFSWKFFICFICFICYFVIRSAQ